MNTYGDPAMENIQQMVSDDVTYFVDLVNQAEQAHFGSGSGGNLMEQGPESAAIPPPIKQAPINNPVSIGFELPQNFGSDPYSPVGNMSPGIAGGFGGF
jgi:hypothetical protein